jgi:hypothetical protein
MQTPWPLLQVLNMCCRGRIPLQLCSRHMKTALGGVVGAIKSLITVTLACTPMLPL